MDDTRGAARAESAAGTDGPDEGEGDGPERRAEEPGEVCCANGADVAHVDRGGLVCEADLPYAGERDAGCVDVLVAGLWRLSADGVGAVSGRRNGAPCGTLTGNACDRTESRRCRYFYGKGQPLCVDRAAAACDHCPGECVAPWNPTIFDDPGWIPGDPACQDAIDDARRERGDTVTR
jgi:hypothetical protein